MENKKQELTNVLKPYAIEYRPDGTTKEITEQEYLMSKDSYPRKGKQKYWKCKYYNKEGLLIEYYLKEKSPRQARESVVVDYGNCYELEQIEKKEYDKLRRVMQV